jgi:hypothetical protein
MSRARCRHAANSRSLHAVGSTLIKAKVSGRFSYRDRFRRSDALMTISNRARRSVLRRLDATRSRLRAFSGRHDEARASYLS